MKRILVIIALCSPLLMQAQSIEHILKSIEQNNKELKAQKHAADATKMENRTNNNLPDPTVSYSSFYSNGAEGGHGTEFVASQGFDFPTQYIARNRHSYNFRPKHFDSVKFNPTRHFVKEVYRKGEKELEHADPTYGFKTSSSKHTQEERFGMLMEYLREYTFITRQKYPVLLYPMIDFIERNPAPFSPNAFVPIPYAARYNHIDACPMGQLQ